MFLFKAKKQKKKLNKKEADIKSLNYTKKYPTTRKKKKILKELSLLIPPLLYNDSII